MYRKVFVAIALGMLAVPAARAAEFHPATVDDLAAAITQANDNSEPDVIHLDATKSYLLTSAVGGGNGLPVIASDITIDGHGATMQRDAAASQFRIVSVMNTGILRLKDIILKGGRMTAAPGGCIDVQTGTLELISTTLTDCHAASGGAINSVFGTVTIRHSALHHNGTTTISGRGGAIFFNNGTLDVINSTFAANEANGAGVFGRGGAIAILAGTANISYSTIAGNTANIGGGISQQGSSTVNLRGTILADNTAAHGDDCRGNMTSLGFNLLTSTTSCTIIATDGDQFNITTATVGLAALIDRSTPPAHTYFPLLEGSAAINTSETCTEIGGQTLSIDQLGNARDTPCDIGAVEHHCGDGVVQTANAEQCDDGVANADTGDCTATCQVALCGDGLVQAGVELCDDGNAINDDDCPVSCVSPACGDGIVQATLGEQCDDGNVEATDGCLNSCVAAICGDGIVHAGTEECDGGTQCTSACKNIPPPTPTGTTETAKPSDIGGTTTTTTVGETTEDGGGSAATPSSGGCSLIPVLQNGNGKR